MSLLRPPNDLAEVFVYLPPVDFRKAVNGLAMLVQEVLQLDAFSERLYVFRNRRCDKVKILYWEGSGFVLWYKRLERQRFHWPAHLGAGTVTLTGQQLNWLLDGAPQAHGGEGHGYALSLCKAVGKMAVGPPESVVRSRLQTTASGCH